MKEFILVISMWGSDGVTEHYIGQIALQQPFSEKQCNMLIEEDMPTSDIIEAGYEKDTVLKVFSLLKQAEYKRRQAAPGPKLSAKAFGRDRRYPITNKYSEDLS